MTNDARAATPEESKKINEIAQQIANVLCAEEIDPFVAFVGAMQFAICVAVDSGIDKELFLKDADMMFDALLATKRRMECDA